MPVEIDPVQVDVTRTKTEKINCDKLHFPSLNIVGPTDGVPTATAEILPYAEVDGEKVFAATRLSLRTSNLYAAAANIGGAFAAAIPAVFAGLLAWYEYMRDREATMLADAASETDRRNDLQQAQTAVSLASAELNLAQIRLGEAQAVKSIADQKAADPKATDADKDAAKAAATDLIAVQETAEAARTAVETAQAAVQPAQDALTVAAETATKSRLAWLDPANTK